MKRALPLFAGWSVASCAIALAAAQGIILEPAPKPNEGENVPPRSVTIIPDTTTPGAAAPATPAPDLSPARLEVLNSTVKVENPAGVSLDLLSGPEVAVGAKMSFRIATHRSGYLILLDIDAAGKLTQIFPNTATVTRGVQDASNRIRRGRALTIPQLGGPYANFEFMAELPAGVAMAVAMLSDRPVQVVDLPDAPPPAFAPADALKYVRDQARTLKVPGRGGNLEQPAWSIDGKFYLVK